MGNTHHASDMQLSKQLRDVLYFGIDQKTHNKAKQQINNYAYLCLLYFSYFDFMGLGDYILYRNTERNFEVGNIIVKMVKLLAWPTLTAQLN